MENTNAIVIGGGIIGCAITYYLTKLGIDTILLEKHDLAAGASRANQGYCGAALYKKPLLNLTLASHRLYEELSKELLFDIEFRNTNSLFCISEEYQWPTVKEHLSKSPLKLKILYPDELKEIEPKLSSKLLGAITYSKHSEDYSVNSLKAILSLAYTSKTLGAKIRTFNEVKKIVIKGGKVDSVITNNGRIKANYVVISAGAWSPYLMETVGIKLPVLPQKGQAIVTERFPLSYYQNITDIDYLTTCYDPIKMKESDNPRIQKGIAGGINQTKDGHFIIGTSRTISGFSRRTSLETLAIIASRAIHFIPSLSQLRIIRTFAGIRPFTYDSLPILGEIDEIDGLILATGHGGSGINLAPITGKLISEVITKRKPSINLKDFSFSRSYLKCNNN
jgi:sarcosine oxidase subunit beta